VHQTLGGAWADNFGPGIDQISISGHTGWRRRDGSNLDGQERFTQLKAQVFDEWHARRRDAIRNGQDPDTVQLIFADALDNFAVVVLPGSFTLRRSRSRPLISQYQIAMTVLDQNIDQAQYLTPVTTSKSANGLEALGLDSLTASIGEINGYIGDIQNFVDKTIAAPVKSFMDQTARLYGAVRGSIAKIDGLAGSLISVAQMTAKAGINIFRTLAAVASIPGHIKSRLMQIAGAYSNIFCVLKNALHQQIYYPDYSPLFGSSNCSSTSGGRPISSLSGQNPFYSVVPTRDPLPISLSSGAQTNLRALASSDPVLAPMSTSSIGSALSQVTGGMSVLA
jgi:hypothetical protein